MTKKTPYAERVSKGLCWRKRQKIQKSDELDWEEGEEGAGKAEKRSDQISVYYI